MVTTFIQQESQSSVVNLGSLISAIDYVFSLSSSSLIVPAHSFSHNFITNLWSFDLVIDISLFFFK